MKNYVASFRSFAPAALFTIIGGGLLLNSAGAETVFSQDFENGLGPDESVGGSFSINDSLASINNGTLVMGHSVPYGPLGGAATPLPSYSYYELTLDLRAFTDVEMRFDFSGAIEKDYDGFNLIATTEAQVSPPTGLLTPAAGSALQYDADALVQHGASSSELGAIAWSSPADPSIVVNDLAAVFDLSAFSEEKVIIRFQFGTDAFEGGEGANFDNIVVEGTSLPDTDSDGMPDSYEDRHGLDPATDDGMEDLDLDGVDNITEYNNCTDPNDPDSDDDGLDDGAEIAAGADPLNPDSDGDSLLDGVETGTGIFVDANNTGTSPLDIDSDGDGANDSFEVTENTDPNDATSTPSIPIVQPSFVPINELAPGSYGPDFTQNGVDYQENHYGGGVIFSNNALGNYTVHTSGVPAPTASLNAIEPLTAHGNGGGTISIHNRPWLDAGGDNFTVRYNGYLDMSAFNPGTYKIHLGADDTNYFVMDTADGQVTSQHNCCPANQEHPFTINIPGMFPFDNVFGEQGGGDWTEVGISGPGIAGIVALGDTANGSPPVYPIGGETTDSDRDDLPDLWETSWAAINDLTQLSDTGDFDADGLTDLEELTAGTNPTNADSDGDGIADGAETNTGTFVNASDTGTNPGNPDSDSDGLEDGAEVDTHQTDPTDADSDDDGTHDGDEILAGTNPNDPNSNPPLALPIGYWSFDDQGAGGTTADLSNGGNDGTLNGGPEVVEGPCGAGDFALKFDGIDDSVTTEVSLFTGGAEFTMSGWVKFETAQIGNRIGLFGQNDAVEFGLINPAQLQHWTNVGGALNVTVADTSPEWMHVAITGDAAGRIAYLNGVAELTPGNPAAGSSSAFPFNIGGSGIYDASGNWFTGCIDEVAVWDKALTADEIMQLATCAITPLGRPRSQVGVEITEFHRTGTGDIQISWKSRQDRQYDILSNADLSTPRLQWAGVAGAQDIQGDASGITTMVVATPFPETGYLVVREEGLPALFEDDLESDTGWTAIVNDANGNTNWERGSPNGSTGPLTGADGSANAWCTNLADYGPDSDISLRSPAIDLTGVVGAELSFEAFRDGDGLGDVASVRFLRAADQVQLGAEISIDMTAFDADYTSISVSVPVEAIRENVHIEFNFVSDSSPDAFSGLSIDNVKVEVGTP